MLRFVRANVDKKILVTSMLKNVFYKWVKNLVLVKNFSAGELWLPGCIVSKTGSVFFYHQTQ